MEDSTRSFARPRAFFDSDPGITRRRGILATFAALPFLGLGRAPATKSQPGIKTLDPSDPMAIELDRLWRELRESHVHDVKAHLAYMAESDRIYALSDDETDEEKCEKLDELHDVRTVVEKARRRAYFRLLYAVVDADGRPDPTEATWRQYGTPLASVRVGDRIYAVTADSDSELDGLIEGEFFGLAEVVVVDGIGGDL